MKSKKLREKNKIGLFKYIGKVPLEENICGGKMNLWILTLGLENGTNWEKKFFYYFTSVVHSHSHFSQYNAWQLSHPLIYKSSQHESITMPQELHG